MAQDMSIKKVVVIGSGPIVIGQAAEFDYAGTQACRVLHEAGVNVVLVNSNPATIMTDAAFADEIYLEPLTAETLKRIIIKEKPDSLLAGLGGQTGLTLSMQLDRDGFLTKHGVRLIGTNVEAIDRAEDRKMFRDTMEEIGEPVIPSEIVTDVEGALSVADAIGYPVIVRPAFTLGGTGGGVAYNADELKVVAHGGLDASPITQILVEKYIYGWKEIEFEVMRDAVGNAIAICSMENVDPVGVHTGDSIVVAPALTLSDKEYQMLRSAALNIISALGIVGGCNCQFALHPNSFDYAVIEVNPRVSRSSALASKATGYPIAKITTKIALGYTLDEITNDITGKTCACFEPAIDYIVVKFPKWPFDKFAGASRTIGTQMKATGEVMAIGSSFESALMKAVRGAEISLDTLNAHPLHRAPVRERLHEINDRRIFTVFEAIKAGVSIDEIFDITKIDRWFLYKLKNLADFEASIANGIKCEDDYVRGKYLGYTDASLMSLSGMKSLPWSRALSYKMVDTCAAEFDAETPYFYSTADKACESRNFPRSGKPVVIVIGSGPIRIGQGIEFDYSSVHSVWSLQKQGYEVVIINNNPETVSTDYDTADRLYFEPLCPEDVMNIIKVEHPVGVVVAFGGQTAIKLTSFLDRMGIKILGTSAEGIDVAEDREKFDALLEGIGITRPKGAAVMTTEEAVAAAENLGYPVLLRPSYVIGGQNMQIIRTEDDVRRYMERILESGIENPVLVDKYMMGTELEVDCISDGKDVLIPGIMEHIERSGVHSGDSIAVYPPYSLSDDMVEIISDRTKKLALALGTKGLVNIQYLIYEGELYVIEVNPRASRTIPYLSKVTGVPMVDIASRVMTGHSLAEAGYGTGLYKIPPYYAVKVPVFSFEKLDNVNSYLGPEMKSTGEVLGMGKTLGEALFKGISASGEHIKAPDPDRKTRVLISVDYEDRLEIISIAKKLDDLGYKITATAIAAESISGLGIDVELIEDVARDAYSMIDEKTVSFIIYTGALRNSEMTSEYISLHRFALRHFVPVFTSLDTANTFADIIASGYSQSNTELVDINHMRKEKLDIRFYKMQAAGDDYIFIDNRDGNITCPESLSASLCSRHLGIGADGLILIENSSVADAKMRVFNRDGSEAGMAGNSVRSVGKYIYDMGIAPRRTVTVETGSGIKELKLSTRNGKVNYVGVNMGKADLSAKSLPTTIDADKMINYPLTIGGVTYYVTCVSVGNPHCVVFCPSVDAVDVARIGPLFEHSPYFPERINTEFVRVVNRGMVKMRVWERGNGETPACGTGACAAVIAAVENGYCDRGADISVKLRGGDLTVNYTDERVILSGNTKLVFEGRITL
ncbi:MAG: carbamoyl-phosphate synthase large subunit [Clostridia bacterium]|nr:carbamoyl-phosphate synthase large subunit [Clostridia bacterium]